MNNSKAPISSWQKIRKFFNDIHLWGGLISGIIVFIVCITGTIYVYNSEIREASMPEYYKVEKRGQKISPDSLLTLAKSGIKGEVVGIKVPFDDQATTVIRFNKSKETKGKKEKKGKTEAKNSAQAGRSEKAKGDKGASGNKEPERRRRPSQMMVNPYTGELIGDVSEAKNTTTEFMQKMFGLHRWLLLNEIEEPIFEGIENRKLGSWITGTATLLFLLGVLTGIVIWFPKKIRSWKNGFKIRWTANWKRVNHDLHNTLGLYTWLILFLMAVTGPFWSFEWYREGWQKTWGTYQDPKASKEEVKLTSKWIDGVQTLTIEETINNVNEVLPYDGDISINFAKDSTGTISVTKNKVGFFAPSAADKLTLDQYSGEILEKEIFREKSFRNRIGASIKALHIGDVYGSFTKFIYFISCLIATSLPVTGTLIWINKMKKKPKKQ